MTHRYLITQGPIYKVSSVNRWGREKKSTELNPSLKSDSMSRSHYFTLFRRTFLLLTGQDAKGETKIPVPHATINTFFQILLCSIKPQLLQVLDVLLNCIKAVTETKKFYYQDKKHITIHFV